MRGKELKHNVAEKEFKLQGGPGEALPTSLVPGKPRGN